MQPCITHTDIYCSFKSPIAIQDEIYSTRYLGAFYELANVWMFTVETQRPPTVEVQLPVQRSNHLYLFL